MVLISYVYYYKIDSAKVKYKIEWSIVKLENVGTKRLNNLDVIKAICAFLVICIHISYKDEVGQIVTPLCRIAVPIFFMITGFFYKKTKTPPLKQIRRVFVLIILSNLLYLVSGIILNGSATIPTKDDIIDSLIFNSSPYSFHLWYLNALLYVLIIMYLADKIKIKKYLYFFIPVLLVVNIIYGQYSLVILNKDLDPIYMRNYLFMGLPYFLIGNLLYKHREKIENKITIKKLGMLIIILAITTVLEEYVLNNAKMDSIGDIYISTTFLAIAIFLFALKAKQVKAENVLAIVGRKYATYIYIVHVLFINIFNKYVTSPNNIINNTIQIGIFIASLLTSIIYVKVKEKLQLWWKTGNRIVSNVARIAASKETDSNDN